MRRVNMKIAIIAITAIALTGATALYAKPQTRLAVADDRLVSIDNSKRPAADIARDAARKPAEMVRFARIAPGQTVVDMIPGGGYFTRVFAQAVGPKGRVIAFVPESLVARFPKALDGIKALAAEPAYANVTVTAGNLSTIAAAGTVDRAWTSQNYHDLHNMKDNEGISLDLVSFNKAVFAALKPGGLYIVLDHSAAKGSGLRDTQTLHRIDAAAVKAEVIAAGFKFDGESTVLANPADSRTLKVTDPSIRGHTDQFVLRFVKPRAKR